MKSKKKKVKIGVFENLKPKLIMDFALEQSQQMKFSWMRLWRQYEDIVGITCGDGSMYEECLYLFSIDGQMWKVKIDELKHQNPLCCDISKAHEDFKQNGLRTEA